MSVSTVDQRGTVGSRIAEARAFAGLSQSALARSLNLTRGAISQWEAGIAEPTAGNLRAAALLLGVGAEWLSTGQGQMIDERFAAAGTYKPVADGELVDLGELDASLAATLKAALAGSKNRQIWRLSTEVLAAAGYHPGEFLIVDTAKVAKARDIVLAQVGTLNIFRLYFPPFLLTVKIGQQDPQMTVDNVRLQIRGVVVSRYST